MKVFLTAAALALTLWLSLIPAQAQDDPAQVLDFARHLLETGDYYRAVTEAKRYLFLAPQGPNRLEAERVIAEAYFESGQYGPALKAYGGLAGQKKDLDLAAEALLKLGRCLEMDGRPEKAAEHYRWLAETADLPAGHESDLRNQARFRLGWLRLEQGRWSQAREAFLQVDQDHPWRQPAEDLAQRAEAGETLPEKNPDTAGVLSAVLPGAGQMYNGRPTDAALAFSLNAAFIWGAVEAYNQESWPLAALLGLVETVVYGGNIYNAVNGAHIHNREQREKYMEKIRRDHGWRLGATNGGPGLVLTWRTGF